MDRLIDGSIGLEYEHESKRERSSRRLSAVRKLFSKPGLPGRLHSTHGTHDTVGTLAVLGMLLMLLLRYAFEVCRAPKGCSSSALAQAHVWPVPAQIWPVPVQMWAAISSRCNFPPKLWTQHLLS